MQQNQTETVSKVVGWRKNWRSWRFSKPRFETAKENDVKLIPKQEWKWKNAIE